jgi:hypothetical protein
MIYTTEGDNTAQPLSDEQVWGNAPLTWAKVFIQELPDVLSGSNIHDGAAHYAVKGVRSDGETYAVPFTVSMNDLSVNALHPGHVERVMRGAMDKARKRLDQHLEPAE